MHDRTRPTVQFPNFPERIRGLERLAYNLWRSRHRAAQEMFRALDLQSWLARGQNPLRMLALVPLEILEKAARDRDFLERYDIAWAECVC